MPWNFLTHRYSHNENSPFNVFCFSFLLTCVLSLNVARLQRDVTSQRLAHIENRACTSAYAYLCVLTIMSWVSLDVCLTKLRTFYLRFDFHTQTVTWFPLMSLLEIQRKVSLSFPLTFSLFSVLFSLFLCYTDKFAKRKPSFTYLFYISYVITVLFIFSLRNVNINYVFLSSSYSQPHN